MNCGTSNSNRNSLLVTGSSGFIGSRFMAWCRQQGIPAVGLDIQLPRRAWGDFVECDMLDRSRLLAVVREVAPSSIVHLAARTDLDGRSADDYPVNSIGVENLIHAIRGTAQVRRCLFTSSQLVCRIGYVPAHPNDYCPATPYGESKVLTEQRVREFDGGGVTWCLLRPTTIWGPGMNSHYMAFFNHLRHGRYFHMGPSGLWKSYGFVGNTAHEIGKILEAPVQTMHRQTFYLADYEPLSLRAWINAIALGLGRKQPPAMPLPICRTAAWIGDAFGALGLGRLFPLNSFRLNNILTEYRFDMEPTRRICGELPHTFEEGVKELVEWLKHKDAAQGRSESGGTA